MPAICQWNLPWRCGTGLGLVQSHRQFTLTQRSQSSHASWATNTIRRALRQRREKSSPGSIDIVVVKNEKIWQMDRRRTGGNYVVDFVRDLAGKGMDS